MLQQVKYTVSICLGLAFVVMTAQIISRCFADRVPAVRLIKGRRINTLCASDNWKISVDAGDGDGGAQVATLSAATSPERPGPLRRVLAAFLAFVSPAPVRTIESQLPTGASGHFSAAVIPLRC